MAVQANERLEQYVDQAAQDIPVLPTIASQVMKAVDDPDTSREALRKLIEQDASLAVRILEVSNSAMYGFSGQVNNLGQAIGLIGNRVVRDLVLSISMKSVFKRFGLMEKLLWTHSTLAGPVTAALARSLGLGFETDGTFTAGLLHDIGKSALANSHRGEYEEVVARVYNEKMSFVEAERDRFGFDHAELGAVVAERWNLPAHLIRVIRHHHDPAAVASLPEDEARLTALVSLATACLTFRGVGRREPATGFDLTKHHAWSYLKLGAADLEPTLQVCAEQIERAKALIG